MHVSVFFALFLLAGCGAPALQPGPQDTAVPDRAVVITPRSWASTRIESSRPVDQRAGMWPRAPAVREVGGLCRLVPFEGAGQGFFNGVVFRPANNDGSAVRRTMQESVAFLESLGWTE